MPSFKEEHILIVAPGSKTTLAQLGLPDSFGPAAVRIPTRVFIDENGKYTPNKIRAKKIKVKRPAAVNGTSEPAAGDAAAAAAAAVPPAADGDQQMTVEAVVGPTTETALPVDGEIEEEITQFEEDLDEEEEAIYPIVQGRIVDFDALRAVLNHIDNLVSPPMHTPVLVVCDPAWNNANKENIAQFYFEQMQRPAVTFLSNPLAVCSGFGSSEACVIDVGYDKTTVSSVLGYNPVDDSVNILDGIGGRLINATFMKARQDAIDSGRIRGPAFTDNMVEQLKGQPYICEILPSDVPLPVEDNTAPETSSNPAVAASTGLDPSKEAQALTASAGLPLGPGNGTQTGKEQEGNDNDGVLDVASIVASGKASEILAKREQERAEKAPRGGNKKGAEPPKVVRLTNAQKARVPFRYNERVRARDLQAAGNEEDTRAPNGDTAKTTSLDATNESYVYANRETEVGVERFIGCSFDDFLTPLGTAVFDSINSAPADKRQDLWNNLTIVGNGSKIKGLKERIVAHLLQTFLISPNNNTMFTSELPSHFSTPIATGANTPQPGLSHHGAATPTPGAGGSAVNPLLLAATTASQIQNQGGQLAPPGQSYQTPMQPATPGHPGHPQHSMGGIPALSLPHMPLHSPTSIKVMTPKEYFPEWKDHGYEEIFFLGACVQARVTFIMDSQQPASYMTRVQYNEEGPSGVHQYTLS